MGHLVLMKVFIPLFPETVTHLSSKASTFTFMYLTEVHSRYTCLFSLCVPQKLNPQPQCCWCHTLPTGAFIYQISQTKVRSGSIIEFFSAVCGSCQGLVFDLVCTVLILFIKLIEIFMKICSKLAWCTFNGHIQLTILQYPQT